MRLMKHIFCTFLLSLTLFMSDGYGVYSTAAMQSYLTVSDGKNYNFKEICSYWSMTPEKGCVTDFEQARLQPYQAYGLIELYAERKLKKKLVCNPNYTGTVDNYIQCVSVDGNQNYDFHFDTLTAFSDGNILESLFRALCEMHGGNLDKGLSDGGHKSVCYNTGEGGCSGLKADMQMFGSDAEWVGPQLNTGGSSGGNYCYTDYWKKTKVLRNSYDGILNPSVFAGFQMRAGSDMAVILRRYTEAQFKKHGKILSSFTCNKGFGKYATGELTNPIDDILSCKVNGNWVDFRFDDLSEIDKTFQDGARDGLFCMLDQGGTFDGQNCYGLSTSQCKQLENDPEFKNRGYVKWDDNLQTCVIYLKNAAKAEQVAIKNKIAAGVGVAVVFLGVSIATGGTTTTAAIVGTTASGISAGATAVAEIVEVAEKDLVRDFLNKANQCNNSACAQSLLSEFLGDEKLYEDNLDITIINAFDEIVDKLVNKIDDPAFYNNLLNSIEQYPERHQSVLASSLDVTHKTAIIVSCIADVVTLRADKITKTTKGIPGLVQKFLKNGNKVPNFTKTLTNNINKLSRANKINNVSKFGKTAGKISNTNTVAQNSFVQDMFDGHLEIPSTNTVTARATKPATASTSAASTSSTLTDSQLNQIIYYISITPLEKLQNPDGLVYNWITMAQKLPHKDKVKIISKLPITKQEIVFKQIEPTGNYYKQILNSST